MASLDLPTPGVTPGPEWAEKINAGLEELNAGKADLVGGVVPAEQLPSLAISETFVVNTEAAMLALNAQMGDVAVRTDASKTYILASNSPGILGDWKELLSPGTVVSVAGKSGAVVLAAADIASGTFDPARLPQATETAIGAGEIASAAETVAGADDTRFITPLKLKGATDLLVAKSLVDAKGDLIVATANDTPVRLAVGPDGHVLTADSAEASGVKWAAASGGVLGMVPKSGQYLYPASAGQWSGGAVAYASGADLLVPLVVAGSFSADKLACRVTTAEAVNVRVLLYASDADGTPATLVASGTGSASATGVLTVAFSAVDLAPGVYWGAIRTDGGSAVRFWALQSHQVVWGGVAGDASFAKNPLPAADVGAYASPNSMLASVTYAGTGGTVATVPFVAIGRA
jgi:hypothetical protein